MTTTTSTPEPVTPGEIHVDIENGIGWITFSNPTRRNAMTAEMWKALVSATEVLDEHHLVRVVVLRGAGTKAFISGADISELDRSRSSEEQAQYSGDIARGERAVARVKKPVIAMIRGFCMGAGLVVAVDADIRIATRASQFGIPAAKLGLAFEPTAVGSLVQLVGPSVAADLLFSARLMDAESALRAGLLTAVVDDAQLEDEVRAYALRIAANAPLTLRAAKGAIRLEASRSLEEEIGGVREMVDACFKSDDFREGRRAFLEKRPPVFSGR
jgi:enoyl-CoA hydratase